MIGRLQSSPLHSLTSLSAGKAVEDDEEEEEEEEEESKPVKRKATKQKTPSTKRPKKQGILTLTHVRAFISLSHTIMRYCNQRTCCAVACFRADACAQASNQLQRQVCLISAHSVNFLRVFGVSTTKCTRVNVFRFESMPCVALAALCARCSWSYLTVPTTPTTTLSSNSQSISISSRYLRIQTRIH